MYYDRVKASTSTTGTGTITVGGALTGFRPFTAIVDGDTVSYVITNGTNWEIGRGVWNNTAATLTRSPVLSSNSNALINLVGQSIVATTLLASDLTAIEDAAVAMAIALG